MSWEAVANFIKPILEMAMAASPVLLFIVGLLGSIVLIGQAVVVFTPTKKDDEAWAKIKSIPIVGALVDWLTERALLKKK